MRRWFAVNACRTLVVAAILLAWYGVTRHSRSMSFFLGQPEYVAGQIVDWFVSGMIWRHLGITLLETLLSFVIGAAAARPDCAPPASLSTRSRCLDTSLVHFSHATHCAAARSAFCATNCE